VRTSIKKIRAAILLGDKDAAQSAFKEATPVIDRMSRKGILEKNAASRYKSRLNKAIKLIGA